MLLGFKAIGGLKEIDREPSLDTIEAFIGGNLGVIELPKGVNIYFNEDGVVSSNGKPTLLLKYSSSNNFDYESDMLLFGNCLFTSHDELGGSIGLTLEQEHFITNGMKRGQKYNILSDSKNISVLDLCAE